MALVNSRDENGKVNEYGSGKEIFPGKPSWGTSFISDFQPYAPGLESRPGHQTLFDTMRVLTGLTPKTLLAELQRNDPSVTDPTKIKFDDNTIGLLDQYMGARVISPSDTLHAALALKLKVPLEPLRIQ